MKEQSLKDKTAKGLFWGGVSNGVQQLLNLFFGIFLARLLTPNDYGMVGMLTIFSMIAGSIQESGFISALINKKDICTLPIELLYLRILVPDKKKSYLCRIVSKQEKWQSNH